MKTKTKVQIIFTFLCIGWLFSCFNLSHEAASSFPKSVYITSIKFNLSSKKMYARGSDNWPVTWSSEDKQYTSWGDGNGFNGSKKYSMGVAVISGDKSTYDGNDVWYAPFGGKRGKSLVSPSDSA
jgi:hypothetical protein